MLIEKNKIYITELLSTYIVEDKTVVAKTYPFYSKLLNSKYQNANYSHTIHGVYDINYKKNELDLIFEVNSLMIDIYKVTDLFDLCFEISGEKNVLLSEKGEELIDISVHNSSFYSPLILGRQCIINNINKYSIGKNLHRKASRLYDLIQ